MHQRRARAGHMRLTAAILALGASVTGCGSDSTASTCSSGAMRAARSDMTADMAHAVQACSDVAQFAAEYEKAGPNSANLGAAATLNAACSQNLPADDTHPSFVDAPLCRSFRTRCPDLANVTAGSPIEDLGPAYSACDEEISKNVASLGHPATSPPGEIEQDVPPTPVLPMEGPATKASSATTPTADDSVDHPEDAGSTEEDLPATPDPVPRTVTRRIEGYAPNGNSSVENALSVTRFSMQGSDSAVRATFTVRNTSDRTLTLRPLVSATGPDSSYALFSGSEQCYTFSAKATKSITVSGEGEGRIVRTWTEATIENEDVC